jgi:hypothetical protein
VVALAYEAENRRAAAPPPPASMPSNGEKNDWIKAAEKRAAAWRAAGR